VIEPNDAHRLAHLVHRELGRDGGNAPLDLGESAAEVLDGAHGGVDDERRVPAREPGVDDVDLAEGVPALGQ
jgi:hypothetical protein